MNARRNYRWKWRGMIERCYNPKHISYKSYGGRGITVCERWRTSLENYIQDTGPAPDGMTLDRIDNDGPYEPGNVRWATQELQLLNSRRAKPITYGGVTMTQRGWARHFGKSQATLSKRILSGIPVEQIFAEWEAKS